MGRFNQPDVSTYRMRFSQIATMMRLPLVDRYDDLDVAFVGVPFDSGTFIRPGARLGPAQIREMSRFLRNSHPATQVQPFALCQVADVGDAPVNTLNVEGSLTAISGFFAKLARNGVTPLAMGGDHTIPLLILEGMRAAGVPAGPVGLIQIDAHADVLTPDHDVFDGLEVNHGTFARLAIERGLVDPARSAQLGLRGSQYAPDANRFAADAGVRMIYQHEFDDLGVAATVGEIRRVAGDGPVYLTIDVDGLDPSICPGTGYPEPGGLTMRETQGILRGLRGLDLVGGDVSEVAPPFDPSGMTALTAAHLLFEMLCLVAEPVARKKGRL
jgi:guanidinopropionase